MAVLSRVVILAAFVSTSLFVNASPENVNTGGQVSARHLKHPQPRAHHAHVAHRKAKRSADKKRACAAKTTSAKAATTTTTKLTTTTKHTTTTTKHTTTTQKSTTTQASTSSSEKAGLAWNDGNQPYMKNLLSTGKVTWCYTWSPWTPGGSCEFVPMLWGAKQVSDWKDQVVGKKFSHVLGFNEPDIASSSMSVSEACSLWKEYIEPMDAVRVAPAVTLSPTGLTWLSNFMNECGYGSGVDVYALHWYGIKTEDFISDVEAAHKQFPDKKIWITEWACQNYGSDQSKQCSSTDVKNLMDGTMAWMYSTSYIERFSWFGSLTVFPDGFNTLNRLITSSGALTSLGEDYISW